jgi:hypothetical protein
MSSVIATVAATTTLAIPSMNLFDFSDEQTAAGWFSIDDTVMGGVSSSGLEPTSDDSVVFRGNVSLENNGGFASVRSRPQVRDLRGYAGLALRVRGDGHRYKLNLKTDDRFDGILYRAVFDTRREEWQTISLRFEDFVPTFRGRTISGAGPLDLSRIVSFGLMISDKQAGPFQLELASIDAIRD